MEFGGDLTRRNENYWRRGELTFLDVLITNTFQSNFADNTKLHQVFSIHLLMVSDQRLEVYDRMGNVVIKDPKPRRCEEIVTFIHQFPDTLWLVKCKSSISSRFIVDLGTGHDFWRNER